MKDKPIKLILRIDSSARRDGSVSRALGDAAARRAALTTLEQWLPEPAGQAA